ncbi:complement C1q-like protein 2 [Esox lucius]|uniref:C1q domain-containing protein n=1 Tax=Esox lucius TaxID=8010 RepID=A0A6Q2X4I1_ESOLU|nr:complement C1q-like protein 2 [Esox lucius]XP_010873134.1 complement C1q-like protein 2 [Esox lucius]XP_012991473.1 complement C1q-like protein 2 [Esox lucius]XP_019906233.1 complement C1q-like protein 2 [Esox lucius]
MRVFSVVFLLLAPGCLLSVSLGDNQEQKACCLSDPGCLMKELVSIGEKLGTMLEKQGTMGDNLRLMETRLQTSEKEVEELKRLTGGQPKVAFSAALRPSGSGETGPFNADTALQYKKVFSNTGNCYNSATGVFTAQVKGMYYFRFTLRNNWQSAPNSVAWLSKNDQRLVSVWDNDGSDLNDSGSNAVVIPLEVGDQVYVVLQAKRLIYDDPMNYNTFSGFLLFTM